MRKTGVVLILATALASLVSVALLAVPAAAVAATAPYSSTPVRDADLDGNPATGAWADAASYAVPLENGDVSAYGTATVFFKHNGTSIFIRIDGASDIPWTSPTGAHFWLGFLLSPAAVAGHHRAGQDSIYFGETSYPGVTLPLVPVDTNGGARPPAQDTAQDALGRMAVTGAAAPHSFTAEWTRRLNTGDAQDVALIADGATTYNFYVTTDSNGGGSAGGNLDHAVVTNTNTLKLARPVTGDVEPPRVSIDAPANGSNVQGVVQVTVTATDNVAVDRVELFIDAARLGTDATPPFQFSWDTAATRNGPHRVTAKAWDTSLNNASAWIAVTVANPDPIPPVADAGPDQRIPPGVVVTLDGSASTDNQAVVNWTWSVPEIVPVALYGAVVTYAFQREGHFLVTLRVRDAAGNSDVDTAWVYVLRDAGPPVARTCGNHAVPPGSAITFNGSRSADDVGIANYTCSWIDVERIELYGAVVTHTFEREGHFLITLTVRDFVGNPASDVLWVNVSRLVDWSTAPWVNVTTTEGGITQVARVQVATGGGYLFFHANFTYAGDVTDPDMVYFAVEFDRSGTAFPMSAGNEMIIVSRKDASGAPTLNYSYYVGEGQRRPTPITPSPAKLISYRVRDRTYDLVFLRPLNASDSNRQVELAPGTIIRVAFAVGEWGRGNAHAYTLMAWQLETTAHGALLRTVEGPDQAAVYRLANVSGQVLVVFTITVLVLHAFRRRVWRGVHPVETYCGTGKMVEVERHSPGIRASHWTHVGLMFVFIATGWSIFARNPVLGPNTVPVHIAASFLILAIDFPVHFYLLWRSGDVRFLFIPSRDDLRVNLALIANFFGLSKKYEEHATVDPKSREWYKGRKYCAFQKQLLQMDLLAILLMAATGYALFWPTQFAWLYDFLRPMGGYFAIRGLHLVMFYYFVSTLIAHVYLAVVPMNRGKLHSMVRGKGEVHLHGGSEPARRL